MKEIEIYIDGASKGNPGPSGIGVIISEDNQVIKNISNYIGHATNNVAEYTALIYGLQEALILGAKRLKVKTDSELLYKQMNNSYKVKNAHILVLYNQARHLLSAFETVTIDHIRREHNCGADKLATAAIKKQQKLKV